MIQESQYMWYLAVMEFFIQVDYDRETSSMLIHCGLMMPYGDIDLGQHWLR